MQTGTKKPRGRPKEYDPDEALDRAMDAFWKNGYSATCLDDLSRATGMNRPSLYGAFGDKREIYLRAFAKYLEDARAKMRPALAPEKPLREAMIDLYSRSLDIYFPTKKEGRGCFMIGTAMTEVVRDPAIRKAFAGALREIDAALEARIRLAKEKRELPAGAEPRALASVASAILYSIAMRSRAGDSRETLEAVARHGVDLICGTKP